jgi:hypothetical protein
MTEADQLLTEAEAATAQLPTATEWFGALSDTDLMSAQRTLAAIGRRVAASSAAAAAEIAFRSRADLGYAGLAQRTGARTPEFLVQQLTGSTGREAATLVRVGGVMAEAQTLPPGGDFGVGDADPFGEAVRDGERSPGEVPAGTVAGAPWDGRGTAWLASVGRAVASGALTVDAADAIRTGLGTPAETVSVEQLSAAAQLLVGEAAHLNADQLLKRARVMRDQIDHEGAAQRERERHEQRTFRVFKRRDGMIKGDFLLAPESGGAEVLATFEAVTAPRRGGPRFVDKAEQERAKRILDDPRSTEQLQADALVELVRLGAGVDPGAVVGSTKPSVRVLVTAGDLRTADAAPGSVPAMPAAKDSAADGAAPVRGERVDAGAGDEGNVLAGGRGTGTGSAFGIGWLEGHPNAISIGTVRRNVCVAGILPIYFDDDGQSLNVGRDHRLFTARQRIALAARDGGCRAPGCDRPPSWCEAHHIDQWQRDGGATNIADGILLCRHHHMLVHNNGWRIRREGSEYFLIPPRSQDPEQTPIPMPTKSLALMDLRERKRAS